MLSVSWSSRLGPSSIVTYTACKLRMLWASNVTANSEGVCDMQHSKCIKGPGDATATALHLYRRLHAKKDVRPKASDSWVTVMA